MTAATRRSAATQDEKTQAGPVRLSVNLGAQPAAALRELMNRKEISATEAIRRALSVWKFIEDEREQGRGFAVLDTEDGKRVTREVIFHD